MPPVNFDLHISFYGVLSVLYTHFPGLVSIIVDSLPSGTSAKSLTDKHYTNGIPIAFHKAWKIKKFY